MAVPFEPVMLFWCPSGLRKVLITTKYSPLHRFSLSSYGGHGPSPKVPFSGKISSFFFKKFQVQDRKLYVVVQEMHRIPSGSRYVAGSLRQTGKKGVHEFREFQFLNRFSAKFVLFSAKFGTLNVQIRNTFKNIIFIGCKWCKICKYYVNSMVISGSTCEKEDKECKWVKYLIYSVLLQFQICQNLCLFFRPICIPKVSELTKIGFCLVCLAVWRE